MTRPKGAHGEGGIRQLPSGRFQWRATATLPDGQPVSLSGTEDTKKAAIAAKQTALVRARSGTLAAPDRITVGEWLERWPTDKTRLAEKTRQDHRQIVDRHIVPRLGTVRLQTLTPARLRVFYGDLTREGKGTPIQRKVHVVLHGALNEAMKLERVARNVAAIVKPEAPRDAEVKPRAASALTRDEVRRFVAAAEDDRWGRLFVLLLQTGLRRGEACGLKWANVDLERGQLRVAENVVSVNGRRHTSTPKTARSHRVLPLSRDARALLTEHRRCQEVERAAQGTRWKDEGYAFPTTVGTAEQPDNLRRHLVRLLDRAGVRRVRIHDLRHTHATLMVAAGAPMGVVSEKLGHSRQSFTADTYAHTLPEAHERWALDLTTLTQEDGHD